MFRIAQQALSNVGLAKLINFDVVAEVSCLSMGELLSRGRADADHDEACGGDIESRSITELPSKGRPVADHGEVCRGAIKRGAIF